MKVLIISGSRNPQGQTARAAAAFAAGVQKRGGTAETVFLTQMKIERCRQCDAQGWGICRTEGRCIIEDDLAALADKVCAADAVAFATPVYFSDVSESLRAFMDRLRRTCRHADGKKGITDKPAAGICVAGGGGGGAFRCAGQMEWLLATTGLAVQDIIPIRKQNLDYKLAALTAAGEAFAGALNQG